MLYAQKRARLRQQSCSRTFICEIKPDYSIQYVQKIRNLFVKNIKI